MTRIAEKFETLKAAGEKALVPFFFAGDPSLGATERLVLELEKKGADIIELGIPYTDPLADGPVNQAAAARALSGGVTLTDILALVAKLREKTQVPIAFLLYFNCVLQYGVEKFLADCGQAGVDGVVIPDLPMEERARYADVFSKYDVDVIPLVTPVSGARTAGIVAGAEGFVYCVTSTGTTGVRSEFATDFDVFMDEVAAHTKTPRVLGFGISTSEHVRAMKGFGEGLIVGSAIVKKMNEAKSENEMIAAVSAFVGELKQAMK